MCVAIITKMDVLVNMDLNYKFIHLLYVPTMSCNMSCKYCYLEDNTKDEWSKYNALDTLKYAIEKFRESNVIPFNISLHGGEVTTLNHKDFHDLIKYIADYYHDNSKLIESNGFKIGKPHIKTNLYNLEKHLDTIKKYNVSISGSLDLPFSMHDKYRVTKGNKSTLTKIFKNIDLLADIPNKKKVSATIFREHFNLDEIIDNIKYLHNNTCLDMNDFNFMIGFDYNSNGLLHHLTEKEQLELFYKMHKEFDGTDLDSGVNGAWFNEFGPEYCTNCDNCGEKFFLLEKNGDIYSCVRGQKNKDFYYGNIYKDDVLTILNNAKNKIFLAHNKMPFNDDCAKCKYLYLCKTGCPFVKNVYKCNKSYTCLLQQALYKNRNYKEDNYNDESIYSYVSKMHPELIEKYYPTRRVNEYKSLEEINEEDPKLKYIYDANSFILKVDDDEYKLQSQILKKSRQIIYITPESKVEIYVKDNILDEESSYPQNNSLYIMLLTGDLIEYGDERRTKQAHIMTHQVYKGVLEKNYSEKDGYFKYELTDILRNYYKYLSTDNPNNLFFTTNCLRDYHYTKQKNNAYYHIDAINLPFQNIEFYYLGGLNNDKEKSRNL